MGVWDQVLAGLYIAAFTGSAYVAWTEPRLFLMFGPAFAALLLLAAGAFHLINSAYQWGWEDAIAATGVDGEFIRTGTFQNNLILGVIGIAFYALFLSLLAYMRRSQNRA